MVHAFGKKSHCSISYPHRKYGPPRELIQTSFLAMASMPQPRISKKYGGFVQYLDNGVDVVLHVKPNKVLQNPMCSQTTRTESAVNILAEEELESHSIHWSQETEICL